MGLKIAKNNSLSRMIKLLVEGFLEPDNNLAHATNESIVVWIFNISTIFFILKKKSNKKCVIKSGREGHSYRICGPDFLLR